MYRERCKAAIHALDAVGTYRIVPEEGEMIKMLVASVG